MDSAGETAGSSQGLGRLQAAMGAGDPLTPRGADPAGVIAPALDDETVVRVQRLLLDWYAAAKRDLPWRCTRDPYHILVAEIMLQQTQVSRVLPKYVEFLARFPTLEALAGATRAEVVRAWETLGYNRRAVHLHTLAQHVQQALGGVLPRTSRELRRLPGIGPYTAAAVACFAFGEQVAAVDTNARRVLGRIFLGHGSGLPAEATARVLAQQVLPPGEAYSWNQALMDLGATLCTARRPACDCCPVAGHCAARPQLEQAARAARPGVRRTRRERFEGSARFYRGRIIQVLRRLPSGQSISPEELGRCIRRDFAPDHRPWLDGLLRGLERDGLLVLEHSGQVAEPRVGYAAGSADTPGSYTTSYRVRLA